MFNPVSTYRIQFHQGFTFLHLEELVPYLQALGINTVYASPVFEAVPGSVHGYDVTNPLALNPEIGTKEGFHAVRKKLCEAGINWLQDIVPNHAAFHPKNKWLTDLLEKGQQSVYASFFDTVAGSNLFTGTLMVPFLGSTLQDVINNRELQLSVEDGRLVFRYYNGHYPLKPGSYPTVLKEAGGSDAINDLLQQIDHIHKTEEREALRKGWSEVLLQFRSLMQNKAVNAAVQKAVDGINNSAEKLQRLAGEQQYRLCHWQETDSRINYRRFFTVNDLICLNVQNENVLEEHHSLIKELLRDGSFQGLRVDHVDGLYNPTEYLHRLRKLAGEEAYIAVEKILASGEELPEAWPVQGTTGYEFLSMVNNLFTHKESEAVLTEFYEGMTGDYRTVHQQLHDKKWHILHEHMGGELENLYRYFLQLNIADKKYLARIPADDMKSAIGEFLVQCPVYRFYGSRFPLSGDEEGAVRDSLQRVRKSGESKEAVNVLEWVLLHRPHEGHAAVNESIAKFYQRCMQFTGPLMAKGMEDTLMYTNNRFIGHNEVGDSPESVGYSIADFHKHMHVRQQRWPLSMNATSTHDTKRGEDVRARLNVLTDISEEWISVVSGWAAMNKELKTRGAPDDNDEYLIYQSLVGHYPLVEDPRFSERFLQFLEKALREAKRHSTWANPNTDYEIAVKEFAKALLNKERPFWKRFEEFLARIREHGIINSLSQVLLKFTLPGVPDVYQGAELWDYSFVDPDNRRSVDFETRKTLLHRFEKRPKNLLRELWKENDGGIKLWLTQQLLTIRKTDAGLFAEGDYVPLTVEGKFKDHVFAFARRQGEKTFLFAVPLHTASLCKGGQSFFTLNWEDTRIVLPKEFSGFSDVLSGKTIAKSEGLLAKNLFRQFTAAILGGRQTARQRGAGVLLHITSLPSLFAVGDLGPGARRFADFLHRSGQKYWQLLPLNPTEEAQGWSPYSALSGRAGWPLLISPEALVREGLLQNGDLAESGVNDPTNVNYAEAEKVKEELLGKAFDAFTTAGDLPLRNAFALFCEKERGWLNDFALFLFLKTLHGGKPWYEWADRYKKRDKASLQKAETENEEALRKIKWLQFIFAKQWAELKTYCNNRNIRFVGDMPFYVSYDSADVWAAQGLFSVDEDGAQTGMAGVPPDAFSADGQLWGMPTFNWERMKENGYRWWLQRLRKNKELFDITRLDHFRAFEAYWQVPAGETTARNGQWIQGPGTDFFSAVQADFGGADLPFVAEDLGDINEAVLNLRDEAVLPGMKVLQFAFGPDMSQSGYIPHNYERNFLVYTGTHDNNTTVGWWRTEADESIKKRVAGYVGVHVDENNVHNVFQRLAYGSVADTAIIPMQDILGLDETGRMNVPSSAKDNWSWRLTDAQLASVDVAALRDLVKIYNRE